MSEKDEQIFQCCICDKLFDVGDNKGRNHCHVTGKYSQKIKTNSAHWSCNNNLKLTKKFL